MLAQRDPIKVVRWLRHLNFSLHAERHNIQRVIDELEPRVFFIAKLVDPALERAENA